MYRLPGTWVSLPLQKKFLIYPVHTRTTHNNVKLESSVKDGQGYDNTDLEDCEQTVSLYTDQVPL